MLAANSARPKRERLTYQRIFEELRLEGYRGSYVGVRPYGQAGPCAKASVSPTLMYL